MDTKLALVDSIENIKEKITSQEYKDILENLAKVTVAANKHEKGLDDLVLHHELEPEPEITELPDIFISVWDGTKVTLESMRDFNLDHLPVAVSDEFCVFFGVELKVFATERVCLEAVVNYIIKYDLTPYAYPNSIKLTTHHGVLLRQLLNVPEDKELTYYNLKSYVNNHMTRWNDLWNDLH
jgi:hypothetical protein